MNAVLNEKCWTILNRIWDTNLSAGMHGAGPKHPGIYTISRGAPLYLVGCNRDIGIYTGSFWTGSGYYNLHGTDLDGSVLFLLLLESRDRA